ncbi:hypothetical protein BTZ20_1349 [Rhodococcus sp. MTM3W5.2]|nr:hypothetical protein BTZ20_1349 [Rhodococcus sp. MTM3W5.2]
MVVARTDAGECPSNSRRETAPAPIAGAGAVSQAQEALTGNRC